MNRKIELRVILLTASTALASPAHAVEDDAESVSWIVVNGEKQSGYTIDEQSTAFRLPLSVLETPQSVSVVTRSQIDDFNLDSVNRLLAYTTGVNVEVAETERTYYNARGFDIVNFQYDGVGQPLSYGLQRGPLDTITYERVEVVRGATGLLSQTGNPSAAINFVRKRPNESRAAHINAEYGSYEFFRADADANIPITTDGRFKARAVGAYETSDSYLDYYHTRKISLYGVISADLTPTTSATAGYSWQKSDPKGVNWGSLPMFYTNGSPIVHDRSSTTAQPWSRWEVIDRSLFGDVQKKLGDRWKAQFSVLRRVQDQSSELFYVYGTPDPTTGEGLFSYPGSFAGPQRDLTLDLNFSGTFSALGRDHELMLGANYGRMHLKEFAGYDWSAYGVALPGNMAYAGNFPHPDFEELELQADFVIKRRSAYGLARLSLADPVKIITGGNITRATSTGTSYGADFTFAATRFLPFAGVTVDIDNNLVGYASYATIFNPQTELDRNFEVLDPLEGETYEVGLKGQWNDGKALGSIALFKTRQKNTAESAGFDLETGQNLYDARNATSRGVEIDIAGEVLKGLMVAGGYAYTDIEDDDGVAARTFIPRHTARVSVAYVPEALPELKVGASARYQSRIWRSQGTVAQTGAEITTEQDDYVLVDLMASFQLTTQVILRANLNNLTNAKYLTSLLWDQAFYGAPRTVAFSVGYGF